MGVDDVLAPDEEDDASLLGDVSTAISEAHKRAVEETRRNRATAAGRNARNAAALEMEAPEVRQARLADAKRDLQKEFDARRVSVGYDQLGYTPEPWDSQEAGTVPERAQRGMGALADNIAPEQTDAALAAYSGSLDPTGEFGMPSDQGSLAYLARRRAREMELLNTDPSKLSPEERARAQERIASGTIAGGMPSLRKMAMGMGAAADAPLRAMRSEPGSYGQGIFGTMDTAGRPVFVGGRVRMAENQGLTDAQIQAKEADRVREGLRSHANTLAALNIYNPERYEKPNMLELYQGANVERPADYPIDQQAAAAKVMDQMRKERLAAARADAKAQSEARQRDITNMRANRTEFFNAFEQMHPDKERAALVIRDIRNRFPELANAGAEGASLILNAEDAVRDLNNQYGNWFTRAWRDWATPDMRLENTRDMLTFVKNLADAIQGKTEDDTIELKRPNGSTITFNMKALNPGTRKRLERFSATYKDTLKKVGL
jgi:hypothetical protein